MIADNQEFMDFLENYRGTIKQQMRMYIGDLIPFEEFEDKLTELESELYIVYRQSLKKNKVQYLVGYLLKALENHLRNLRYTYGRELSRWESLDDEKEGTRNLLSMLECRLDSDPVHMFFEKEMLATIISGLDPLGREVLQCKLYPGEELTQVSINRRRAKIILKDIAQKLNVSVTTVWNKLIRARELAEEYRYGSCRCS